MKKRLSQARRNEQLKIVSIPDMGTRTQLIRFGISEGTTVRCHQKLPLGPLIIRYKRQEIAIGREIADTILTEKVA